MKKFLATALVVVMAFSALAGCSSSSSSSSDTEAEESSEDAEGVAIADEIVMAVQSDGYNFDPVTVNDNGAIWLYDLFLEGLVMPSDDGTEIVPCLAESWEISDDGLTYTFNLKPDVKFADGTDVTAEDWIWTFERAKAGTEGWWAFAAEDIDTVTSPSDDVLVVTLTEPNAAMLANFTNFNMFVQSKAFYEENGYDTCLPMGTGPYMAVSWEKEQEIVFTKNPYYRVEDEPKTETIRVLVVPDDESRVMQLQAGEVDIIGNVPFSSMQVLEATDGIVTSSVASMSNRYIVFNTRDEILSNKEVRQALAYATNKQEIVDMVLYGYGEVATTILSSSALFHDDDLDDREYDIETAKELLASAGYPDGFELEFLVRSGNTVFEQIATIIKSQWAEIGVDVTLTTLETATLLDLQTAGNFQVLIGTWSDDILDPVSFVENTLVLDTFSTGYTNEEAEEMFDASTSELDEDVRGEYFKQIQEIYYEDVPINNLYHEDICSAMSDSIDGFVQIPLGRYRFNNLVKYE
ncbi:MAG: ABC transporter substrate-binding protein [Clostridiales bacterium]|nr:ABC transporter substrate-binding protein [Clostridiales bacterium]